jgi:uncharacterized protein (TIGR00106 family)
MKARMEIASYPLGTGDVSVSREVSRVFGVLDRSGLPYEVTVMGTVVEGAVDRLFALAREIHDAVASDEVNRVVTVIRIDERKTA